MLQKSTALSLKEAYNKLREIVLKEECRIIEEKSPNSLTVKQGSSLEYSPRTFKKIIKFNLIPEGAGTRIISDTRWTTTSIVEAILTPIIIGIVIVFLSWLVLDISAYVEGLRSSIGGWLLELFGYTGFRQALALINILEILISILVAVEFFGITYSIYCYVKREIVAEEILSLLP